MTLSETHRTIDAHFSAVEALLPAARRQNLLSAAIYPLPRSLPLSGWAAPALIAAATAALLAPLRLLGLPLLFCALLALPLAVAVHLLAARRISAHQLRPTPARERLRGELACLERALRDAGLPPAGLVSLPYPLLGSAIVDLRARLRTGPPAGPAQAAGTATDPDKAA